MLVLCMYAMNSVVISILFFRIWYICIFQSVNTNQNVNALNNASRPNFSTDYILELVLKRVFQYRFKLRTGTTR
jgi:hypothetical protein